MNRNIFNREYWYNYVDIDILLKSKSENQYYVWESTSQDFNHFSKTIKDVCEKLKHSKEDTNTTVIPINTGYMNDGKYEGSHWVGLVIKIDSNDIFEAFYCDSLGNSLNESLISVLNNNGIDAIRNCSARQQHNTFDCGPFLVFNLDSLAKTDCLPLNINESTILSQRSDLQRIIECGSEGNKLIDIPDLDANVVIQESISKKEGKKLIDIPDLDANVVIQESVSKKEADRNKDLNNLELMFKAIIDCETNPSSLRSSLITISELAGQISYNDTGDKENRYIRNRYGYIQRNQNKLINKDGIYFESIYHLKIILSDDEIYSSISIEKLNKLRASLSGLKQKIAHIFSEQNASVGDVNGDFCASIEGLTDFSRKYYDPLLIKQVKQELEHWEPVDFSVRDDRYYLARVLCKIGELFNELRVNLSAEDKKQDVMAALKCFIELRDQFIHHRDKVRFGLGPEQCQSINALIVDIRRHLEQIIVVTPDSDEDNHWPRFEIDRLYKEARDFRGAVDQLLSHITGKVITDPSASARRTKAERRREKPVKQLTNEEMRDKLDRLVKRACDLIKAGAIADPSAKKRRKSAKSIEDQLKHFDVEYQLYLQKLGDKIDRHHYPPSLDLEHTDEVIKCCSEIVPAPNTQPALLNEAMENRPTEDVERFHLILDEISEQVGYVSVPSIETARAVVDKKSDESGRKFLSYLEEIRMEIDFLIFLSINRSQEAQERSSRQNEMRLQDVRLDIDYWFNLVIKRSEEAQTRNSPRKLSYIYQHTVLVIGQLVRDIEMLNMCQINEVVAHVASSNAEQSANSILMHLDKFKSSILLMEGKFVAKSSRNRGLAHDITTFNEPEFYMSIMTLLPSIIHLESFCQLFLTTSDDISVKTLHNIGMSLSDIGLYDLAVEYMDKAIARYQLYPDVTSHESNDGSSDEYKLVLGLDRSLYMLYKHLSLIHLKAKRFDKFNEVSELLMGNINPSNIENGSDALLKDLSGIHCNTHFYFKEQGKNQDAIRVLQEAESIFENNYTKICLANLYVENREYEEARELLTNIISNSKDVLHIFQASDICITIYSEQRDRKDRIAEIKNCVDTMDTLLQTYHAVFKGLYGDDYLMVKLVVIERKLSIILGRYRQDCDETVEEEFELTKLIELEREFRNIMNRSKDEQQNDPRVIALYFSFCVAFCCIFDERNIHLDVNGENLTKAQIYFDLATKVPWQWRGDQISHETDLATTASCLSNAYYLSAVFYENLSDNVKIEYLMKALNLQEKYNLRKTETVICLAMKLQNLGIEYCKRYEQNGRQEFVDLSLANFNDAVKYFSLALQYQMSEVNPQAINSTQIALAYCYNATSIFQFELRLIRESISRFDYLLTLPLTETETSECRQHKFASEQILSGATKVLNDILNSRLGCRLLGVPIPYIADYCRRRLDIHIICENGAIKWVHRGKLSWDELANQIYQELNISDEMILIYRFYKVLVSEGFLKM